MSRTDVSTIVVKLDMSEAIAAIKSMLEPGAVLLSAEAVVRLFDSLDEARTLEAVYALLTACGGIVAGDKP